MRPSLSSKLRPLAWLPVAPSLSFAAQAAPPFLTDQAPGSRPSSAAVTASAKGTKAHLRQAHLDSYGKVRNRRLY